MGTNHYDKHGKYIGRSEEDGPSLLEILNVPLWLLRILPLVLLVALYFAAKWLWSLDS